MQIVFVHVAGMGNQEKLGNLIEVLQRYSASILDIEQALTHNSFGLSIMVAIPSGPLQESFLADLKEGDGDGTLQVFPITRAEYETWVHQGGNPKQVITLLGHTVTATILLALFKIIQKHSLKIDRITRLSGRIPLETQENARMVLELVVFNEQRQQDTTAFHADILSCGKTLGIDIAVQEDNIWRYHRRLVCFDMDSTLVQMEVIDELAKIAGVVSQVQTITEAAMQGKINFAESFHSRMALLKGIPEARLKQLAEALPITPGAEKLISTLKRLGFKTAILSGGFLYFAKALQERLGLDLIYANTLDLEAGKTTGKVIGEIVDGERKAARLKEIASEFGISLAQVVAIGDGANDIPMLTLAGLGIAFQAKPIVLAKTHRHLTHFGIDGVLYLLGFREEHLNQLA